MSRIAEQAMPVTGGVDTHADVHVAAGRAGRHHSGWRMRFGRSGRHPVGQSGWSSASNMITCNE